MVFRERPLLLPATASVPSLASACREAAFSFLRDAGGWTKRDLAGWLAGPYRTLTGFALRPARETSPKPLRVDDERLLEVICHARRELRETVAGLRDPEVGIAFAAEILGAGYAHRCVDRNGADGWTPIDMPRMRLVARVASLVAVDYLIRTQDYERQLAVCVFCGDPSFDLEDGAAATPGELGAPARRDRTPVCSAHRGLPRPPSNRPPAM